MTIYDAIITPFVQDPAMRRALAVSLILALGSVPLGVFMNLRQMSLVGDAMSHAILPGVSIAFLFFGMSMLPLMTGAMLTGLVVAVLAFALVRMTQLKEDSGFSIVYLMCLSIGVTIVAKTGGDEELVHMLFGDALGVGKTTLLFAAVVSCVSVLCVGLFYRSFLIECFDPHFLQAVHKRSPFFGQLFFVLVIMNLVAAFQILGTLMSLGLMILPAIAARFWNERVDSVMALGIGIAVASVCAGLLIAYHWAIPSGPAVVLVAGCACSFSALFGRRGSVVRYCRERA